MLRTFALSLIKPYRRSTLLVLALGLLASFLNAADPLVLKYLFDALGDRDAKAIPFALGALLVAELGRATLSGVVSVKSSDVRLAVERSLRERLVRKLTKASSRYHQSNGAGATVSRVTQSVNAFTTAFGELMLNLLPSLAYLSIALIVMWRMNWKLAVVVLAFTPVAPLIGAWASREQATRERHLTHWWTRLHGRLNEVLAGMSVVKVFGMERTERERFVASQKEGHDIVSRGLRTDAITGSARTLAVSFARLGAIAVGVYLIFHHQLTAGSLVAFLAYVGGIVGPVQSLTTLYQTVRKGIVGVEMMRDIIESPSETPDVRDAHPLEKVQGDLRFENVCFSHHPSRRLIHGFDLHVRRGETVALMGPSGSGKTTLTKLLLRLLPLDGGRITIDGKDIRELTSQSLRQNIAYVAQDTHLFNDTIAANIAYGKPDATRAEIEAAARDAHAHDFISELPDGYDTWVGEGGGLLSGGQRQRVAIARALVKDAPILVMDEATANLDAVTERAVQESLERLRKGRTTIFAAHSLATAVRADRIVVLDGGVVAASGSHAQLLRSSRYYSGVVGASVRSVLGEDRDRAGDLVDLELLRPEIVPT